jgi:hypothetical protein
METRRTGTPTRSFLHALTCAAILWAQIQRSTTALAEKGDTYETITTPGALKVVVRPEVQLRNTALRLLRGYLAVLGLSPVDIGRVDRAALPEEEDDISTFLFAKRREDARFFG